MEKKLYRSTKDKMIGGVAGGLAEYFDIDPTLARIIFVVSLFMGGTGVIAYILLWIIVPEKPVEFSIPKPEEAAETNIHTDDVYQKQKTENKRKRVSFAGIVLIILGMFFLADNFFPRIDFGDFLPIILIIIGIGLLVNSKQIRV
jgi:phage shock protein C